MRFLTKAGPLGLIAGLLLVGCSGVSGGAGPSPVAVASTEPATAAATASAPPAAVTTPAPPTLDLLPAWTAPTKCLPPDSVREILGTGKLKVDAATKVPVCDYSNGPDQYWYWIDPDFLLVDPNTRDTSAASFADAPELGKDAIRILGIRSGGRPAHECTLQVRLDRDHGADSTGDLLTTLSVMVSRKSVASKDLCTPALDLLNAVSHRTAFAAGFTPLPRFSTNCKHPVAGQADKFNAFLKKNLAGSDEWVKDPRFEPLARPVMNHLKWVCGADYTNEFIADLDVVGPAYRTLSAWATEY